MTSSHRSHCNWYCPTLWLRLSSRLKIAEEFAESVEFSDASLEVTKDVFDFDFDSFLFFEVDFEFGVFGIATSGSVLTDTPWFWNRSFGLTFVSTWIVWNRFFRFRPINRAASAEVTSHMGLSLFAKPPCNTKTVQSTKFRKKFGKFSKKFWPLGGVILCIFFRKLATRFRPKGP